MASILLRRATQIANRITAESAFEVETQDEDAYGYGRRRTKKVKTLNPYVTISIDGDPIRRVTMLHESLISRFEQNLKLIEIGTRIRQAIALKQAECGVTQLVTQRVGLVNRQKVLEYLLDNAEKGVLDINELKDRIEAMRGRLTNSTQGAVTAEVMTVLLTEADQNNIRENLTNVKRALLDTDDQLAKLNSSNSIEIKDEDEGYLRDLSIA